MFEVACPGAPKAALCSELWQDVQPWAQRWCKNTTQLCSGGSSAPVPTIFIPVMEAGGTQGSPAGMRESGALVRAENDVSAATDVLRSVTGIAGGQGKRSPADDLRRGRILSTPVVVAVFPSWSSLRVCGSSGGSRKLAPAHL